MIKRPTDFINAATLIITDNHVFKPHLIVTIIAGCVTKIKKQLVICLRLTLTHQTVLLSVVLLSPSR